VAIFPESRNFPPRDFGKNFRYPLPWIFNPCASMNGIQSINKLADFEVNIRIVSTNEQNKE
jgi:hypothetical protein